MVHPLSVQSGCVRQAVCTVVDVIGLTLCSSTWQLVYTEINTPVTDSTSEWTDSARKHSDCLETSV